MSFRTLCVILGLGLAVGEAPAEVAFPGAGGDYGGILEAPSGGDPDNSGIMTVILQDSGVATLKLFWQGRGYSSKYNFYGTTLQQSFDKKGATDGSKLELFCVLDPDTKQISGVLNDPTADAGSPLFSSFNLTGSGPDPNVAAQLEPGTRVAFIEPATGAAAIGGPAEGGLQQIVEDGFSIVTLGKSVKRNSRFVGRLPDFTPYSAGSPLRGLRYALRAGLYAQTNSGSGGQLLGLGDTSAPSPALRGGTASLAAALRWHKRGGLGNANSYPNGINQLVNLNPGVYSPDRDLAFVLTGERRKTRNATMTITNGNLGTNAGEPGPNPLTVPLRVNPFGIKVLNPNPHKVKLQADPIHARFSGSFVHPDTQETIRVKGAFSSLLDLTPGEGRGNFLSRGPAPRNDPAAAASGSVRIKLD